MDSDPGIGRGAGRKIAVVIPVYNHGDRIQGVVREVRKLKLPVFVVDDGSTDQTAARLQEFADITVLKHSENHGKGAALLTGMVRAAKWADWVVTLDADGQHHPEDTRRLIAAIPPDSRPIIVGCRQGMAAERAPWTSRFGRGFSNFWVWMSGGPRLADTQSGFRLYPVPETLQLGVRSRRFQFEVEVLAKARWHKIPVIEVPVRVAYQSGPARISHFRPAVDFFRNSATFARLIIVRMFVPGFLRSRKLTIHQKPEDNAF